MRLGTYYRCKLFDKTGIKATKERVLDVGGYDGYWLSTQKAKNKYVVDLNIEKKYKNIKYLKADATDLPFKSNYFDQVFAFDVLEHIEERKEQMFIAELIRVCKIGGEIILSIPSDKIKIFPPFLTNFISRSWGHFKGNGYSKSQLKRILSRHKNIDFNIIENNALYFRIFYFPLRILWALFPFLAKIIIDKISYFDYINKLGNNGFYILIMSKK